jgi:hypothetical protein
MVFMIPTHQINFVLLATIAVKHAQSAQHVILVKPTTTDSLILQISTALVQAAIMIMVHKYANHAHIRVSHAVEDLLTALPATPQHEDT